MIGKAVGNLNLTVCDEGRMVRFSFDKRVTDFRLPADAARQLADHIMDVVRFIEAAEDQESDDD